MDGLARGELLRRAGALARAAAGPLLRPGSPAYAAVRRPANGRDAATRPLAVLRVRGVADVRAAGWRRAHRGANAARLADVARRYDPDGVFRLRQAI